MSSIEKQTAQVLPGGSHPEFSTVRMENHERKSRDRGLFAYRAGVERARARSRLALLLVAALASRRRFRSV
jgi:hypothetical protein